MTFYWLSALLLGLSLAWSLLRSMRRRRSKRVRLELLRKFNLTDLKGARSIEK